MLFINSPGNEITQASSFNKLDVTRQLCEWNKPRFMSLIIFCDQQNRCELIFSKSIQSCWIMSRNQRVEAIALSAVEKCLGQQLNPAGVDTVIKFLKNDGAGFSARF